MAALVLDLETVPDQALPYVASPTAPVDRDRMLAPVHNRIAVAGAMLIRDNYTVQAMRMMTDERQALLWLTNVITRNAGRLTVVGYNSRGFDLPVIAARCFVHGIPFARYYQGRSSDAPDMRYRYAYEASLDLCDFLADHGDARRARLDAWARAMGWPGKGEVDGSRVEDMVAAGQLDAVVSYNAEDVAHTAAIYLRVQFLRGILDAAAYRDAMTGLLAFMLAEPRLTKLAGLVDRKRSLDVYEAPAPPAQSEAQAVPVEASS